MEHHANHVSLLRARLSRARAELTRGKDMSEHNLPGGKLNIAPVTELRAVVPYRPENETPFGTDGRPMFWKLDGTTPVPATIEEMSEQMRDFNNLRSVAKTTVNGYDVSTVFLCIDHGVFHDEPILFESMIFGDGLLDGYQCRYVTYDQALEGHAALVKRCRRPRAVTAAIYYFRNFTFWLRYKAQQFLGLT